MTVTGHSLDGFVHVRWFEQDAAKHGAFHFECLDRYVPPAPEEPPVMTLRDQFAMAALTAMSEFYVDHSYDESAVSAYKQADAMLEARKTQ